MGNLRQSMTEQEWNELGFAAVSPNGNYLLNTIKTDGEKDIISEIIDNSPSPSSNVQHPVHYGGKDNPYEAIKVIEAWELDFCLGNVIKYISRAGKKGEWKHREDLEKAAWYLNRAIDNINK